MTNSETMEFQHITYTRKKKENFFKTSSFWCS